ncbi:MAG: ABC transporter substrate-binding protein [Candidatus Promineifilaceae bacterium]
MSLNPNTSDPSPTTAPFTGRSLVIFCLLLLLSISLASCTAEALLNPPRAVTQTAQSALRLTAEAAPSPTPLTSDTIRTLDEATRVVSEAVVAEVNVIDPLVVWVNETSAEHQAAAAQIGAEFEAKLGRKVEFQFIEALRVGDLAEVAQANGHLPDLILHGREQVGGLLAAQILDVETATAISAELNLTTAANDLYPMPNGQVPALPSDAFQYMLFYRSDWLGSDFAAPDTFIDIESIAKAFYNLDQEDRPEDVAPVAGIAIPTEPSLASTQRIFEWLAIANGCQLVDQKGEVLLNQPACLETLDYYKNLIFNYSPPDFQTERTTVRAYIDGRTAMMIGTARDIPIILGANPKFRPACAECAGNAGYLAANTGIVTRLSGSNAVAKSVNMSHARLLGITVGADADAAAFAKFWFNEGYLTWLGVMPASKVPLYDPAFADWQALPTGNGSTAGAAQMPQALDAQREGITTAPRWGLAQGHGDLLSETYASKPLLAPFVLRFLGGLVSIEGSLQELMDAVTAEIPRYQFYPTPTPEPTEEEG